MEDVVNPKVPSNSKMPNNAKQCLLWIFVNEDGLHVFHMCCYLNIWLRTSYLDKWNTSDFVHIKRYVPRLDTCIFILLFEDGHVAFTV